MPLFLRGCSKQCEGSKKRGHHRPGGVEQSRRRASNAAIEVDSERDRVTPARLEEERRGEEKES